MYGVFRLMMKTLSCWLSVRSLAVALLVWGGVVLYSEGNDRRIFLLLRGLTVTSTIMICRKSSVSFPVEGTAGLVERSRTRRRAYSLTRANIPPYNTAEGKRRDLS